MIKFDVLSRFTDKVKFTAEIECGEDTTRSVNLGLAVKWGVENNANLRSANLRNANLRNADLRNADLRNADLRNASGLNDYVKCIQIDTYAIAYTSDVMQIGCERHTISEWAEFDDKRILEMDGKTALKWWRKYKSWIFQAIELRPAKPTGTIVPIEKE